MYKLFFKRVIDFTLSLIALLVILPILIVRDGISAEGQATMVAFNGNN